MRAAIDIGSNSVRLALPDGKTYSKITQLAYGIEGSGKLSPAGIINTIAALKEYAALCNGCEIFAFATEAVRRASDGNEFIHRVKAETGIEITLLSPEREAMLALAGAKKPSGAVTVCDLGGGSLEVISSPDGVKPDYIKSLPIGVVVSKNTYNGDYRKAIDEMPEKVKEYGKVPDRPVVISGGSACTIAAAILGLSVYDKDKVSTRFTAKQLDDIMPMLMSDKLAVMRPVCAKRADTIAYGAIIIQALLNQLGAVDFYVSDAGNLEAAIENRL